MINKHLNSWQERFEIAEAMQPVLGKLYRNQGVEVLIYGRNITHLTTIDIIKAHKIVERFEGTKLRLRKSFPFITSLSHFDVSHASIDIGKIAIHYWQQYDNADNISVFLKHHIEKNYVVKAKATDIQDVVLYGFGRIGRLLARLMIEKTGPANLFRLRAIVVRKNSEDDLEKRANLLRRDSIHGQFNGSISIDYENNAIIANGVYIQIIYANHPRDIDFTQYQIEKALIVDNMGIWKDTESLSQHFLAKGVDKVLLTAPAKGDIKNIVFGVNDNILSKEDTIVSAASCTTNAIVPVLKVLDQKFKVVSGHVETIHAYTNDQNLIDNYHKAKRRGRSAPLNMVITSTGAANAVVKVLPQFEGKLTGNAIRVPTPNVSLAIVNLTLVEHITLDELKEYLRYISLFSPYQAQIDYTESDDVVSSDVVGTRYPVVIDSKSLLVNKNNIVLYLWYDNECGYSQQVIGLIQKMLNINLQLISV